MKKFSKFKCTFQVQMYFELGQKNFKVSITSASVNLIQVQVQSSSSVMTLV